MKNIQSKGLRNVRDIGGYVNKEGKTIISNKFLRGNELSDMDNITKNLLFEKMNVKTIIDFRTNVEIVKHPIPKIENVKVYHLPILEDENLGVPRNLKQFCRMYNHVIIKNVSSDTFLINMYLNMAFSDYSTSKYREFFDILLSNPEGAILYNCTEGKDRTGIATMLLMSCLNFDKQTIINDYMESKQFCDIKMNLFIKRCKRLLVGKKITNFISGIMATKELFINAVYDKIEKEYQTIERYLKEKLNLTLLEVERLQALYLS